MAGVTRSPSTFPPFGLGQAVDRAERIWKSVRNTAATDLVIVQSMGHQTLNGSSRSSIAGMKRFGLLEEVGKDKLRLSDDAKALVMLPSDNPQFIETAWKVALNPPLFAELHADYGHDLPDARTLQFVLVSKRYTPDAARDAIRTYKETLEYLRQFGIAQGGPTRQSPVASAELLPDEVEHTASVNEEKPSPSPPVPAAYNASAELHVSLTSNCKAHLIFEGVVTRRSLQKLSRYLEIFAEDYEDEAEQSLQKQGFVQDTVPTGNRNALVLFNDGEST